jgi:hypothetical protein
MNCDFLTDWPTRNLVDCSSIAVIDNESATE